MPFGVVTGRSKKARLGIGADVYDAAGAATSRLTFANFNPGNRKEVIDLGINLGGFGTLAHDIDHTRENVTRVLPRATMKPSVNEWNRLWRWILNTNPGGGAPFTFSPSMTSPGDLNAARLLDYDDTVRRHLLKGVCVDRAILRGQAEGDVTLDLELVGTSYSNPTYGDFPVLAIPTGVRFIFADLAITVAGIAGNVHARSFELTIDHKLTKDRFYFGKEMAVPLNLERVVTISLMPALHESSDMWLDTFSNTDAGVSVDLLFTAPFSTMQITMPRCRAATPENQANVPQEMLLGWNGQAFALAPNSPEITVVLNP